MNLMDMIKGQLTDTVLQKLGGAVGLSGSEAGKAMDAIIPAQLDSIIKMGSNPAGAQNLLGMLGNFANLGNVGDLLGKADGASGLLKMGESLLPALFGNKLGGLVQGISQVTGIGNTNALTGLMKLAGPMVMGSLAGQAKGMNPMQLVGMLGSLRGVVDGTLPKGLGSVLSGLGGMGTAAGAAGSAAVGQMGQAASGAAGTAVATAKRAGFPMWIPIVALLALLGLIFAFCNRTPTTTGATTPAPAFAITDPAAGATVPAGAFTMRGTGTPGQEVDLSLDGTSLGKATVAADGTWSLEVPAQAAGAKAFSVSSPAGNATLNLTVGQAAATGTTCTGELTLSVNDGATVSEGFRFGGTGGGAGYAVTVKRPDRTIGTRQMPLDANCAFGYESRPGTGPITYELRPLNADLSTAPLRTITVTVQ